MNGTAAFTAWSLDPRLIALLLLIAAIYIYGLHRIRRLVRHQHHAGHLTCFLTGLALLFVAAASPLDTFDAVSLSAHMVQHLILMMLAPALLLLGHPTIPMLRGLPKSIVKRVVRPLLLYTPLRNVLARLVSPPIALAVFAVNTVAWHIPRCYEAALQHPPLHAVEHASFFWTGVLFWWPIIRPTEGRQRWPDWIGIPYLVLADILNTALSAFFVFSDRLLYPSYAAFHLQGMSARDDQTLAGVLMWVPGSVVYLVPVVIIAIRLLSPQRTLNTSRRVQRPKTAISRGQA